MKIAIARLIPAATAAVTLILCSASADTVVPSKPSANRELARQLNQAFVEVAEEVSPAVVVITVTQKISASQPGQSQDDEEDPSEQFRRFWHRRFEDAPPEPNRGEGSGVIIRKEGFILTNRHVVEDAEKIEVRLKDGRTFEAEVRGVDAPSDVAVIKINATNLPIARLADSSRARVGEFAIAIGAPFALDYSVTFGHISAKDRSNIIPSDGEQGPTMTDQNFIQTDANINPGNSGGPLVNIDGEVIGINTLIRGLRTGIGFAIPSNLAREVADKLISDGKFTRAWLGVGISSLREDPQFRTLIPGIQDGVVIRSLVPDGPAAKFDLHPADVITAVDGKPVVTSQQLKDEIRTKTVGQDVKLDVFREGKDGKGRQVVVMVKPGEWEEKTIAVELANPPADKGNAEGLGLTVKALTRAAAKKYGVELTEGVIVVAVDKTGLAARKGIEPGDIITTVGHQAITSPRQFHDLTKNFNPKKGVLVTVIGGDGTQRFEILKEGEE